MTGLSFEHLSSHANAKRLFLFPSLLRMQERAIIENTGQHKISEGGKEDLNTPNMWVRRGLATEDMFV